MRRIRSELLEKMKESDPEQEVLFGAGNPNDPNSLSYGRWKIGSIEKRLADNGPVAKHLGQQWAVLVTSQWEHVFRPRMAKAAGVEKNEVASAVLADIARIRNDIIHHEGIATKKNCGRCEVLRWFDVGDPIVITRERVTEFMARLRLVTITAADFQEGIDTWEPAE
jgi:hypothetical protein